MHQNHFMIQLINNKLLWVEQKKMIIQLNYHFDYDFNDNSNNQKLIGFLNDTLCNILMINEIKQLHLRRD